MTLPLREIPLYVSIELDFLRLHLSLWYFSYRLKRAERKKDRLKAEIDAIEKQLGFRRL